MRRIWQQFPDEERTEPTSADGTTLDARMASPWRGDAVAVIAPELKTASVVHAHMELTFENSDLVAEQHQLDILVVLGSLARVAAS